MNQIKKNKTLLFIIGFLLLTNIALVIFVLQHGDHGQKNTQQPGRFSMALQKDVGFSSAQMREYQDLRTAHFDKVGTMFDDVKNTKLDFYALLYKVPVTDSALLAAGSEIAGKQRNLDIQMFRYFERVRNICKPEQRPKFDTAVKQLVIRMISKTGGRKQKK